MTIADAVAQAWQYHQAGHLQEAEWRYRQILEMAPSHADAWYLLGAACQVQGKVDAAVECYQQALRIRPDDADVHSNLGAAYTVQGQLADAIASCREALRLNPSFPDAYNNLGRALGDQGNLEDAAKCYREALRLQPDFAEAYYNLGKVLQEQGKLDEAVDSYRQALRLRPEHADTQNNLGAALSSQGLLDEAEACLRQALALDPGHAFAHNNLGNVLRVQNRLDDAVACYRRALHLKPAYAEALNNLGAALNSQCKPEEAALRIREALRLQPDFADAHCNLGWALQQMGDPGAAEACFREALRLKPQFPEAHYSLGVSLERLGSLAAAEASFREALRHNPRHAAARAELVALQHGRPPEEELDALQEVLKDSRLTDEERSRLHFALTQVHDARGEYSDAARHAQQANVLAQASQVKYGTAYDSAAHRRFVDVTIATLTPQFFERVRGWGLESEVPVFIFGLPRSGTSLVEQILASHSLVHGAGELRFSQEAYAALAAGKGSDEAAFAALEYPDRDTIRRIAADYLDKLQALGGIATRVVDKMPDNYQYLGLLATLFPRARFIHCQRDLRDVAVSCWVTNFAQVNWANDMGSIVSRFREYLRLMDHWRRVLPMTIFEISYEAVVADLEHEARRLVQACGLEWEQGCLSFNETRRPVRTASVIQVRQPIYARSVGRWRHYAEALGPLFTQLDPGSAIENKK
jgi:tetratricopeptide (TPR) repeat protein